jgi:hypothetical protein
MWSLEWDPEVIALTWNEPDNDGTVHQLLTYLRQAQVIVEWFNHYVDDLEFVDSVDCDDIYGSKTASVEIDFDQAHLKIGVRFIENETMALLFKLSCVDRTI